MTADVLSRTNKMDVVSPHIASAAKLRPSPAVPGSMEAAIKMWLQVGNVQKLQQVSQVSEFLKTSLKLEVSSSLVISGLAEPKWP